MKKSIKVTFESPVLCLMVLLSFAVLIMNGFFPSKKIMVWFQTAGFPMDLKNPLSYIRIITHAFGSTSAITLLFASICILFEGPVAEQNYGTIFSSIMIFLSVIVSGVMGTCFSVVPVCGFEPVLFLFVFLNIIASLKKNTLPFVQILSFIILAVYDVLVAGKPELHQISLSVKTVGKPDWVMLLVDLSGGLCGSLICFLAEPKQRNASKKKKTSKKTDEDDAEDLQPAVWYDNEADSPRFKKSSSDEETVVGTLNL